MKKITLLFLCAFFALTNVFSQWGEFKTEKEWRTALLKSLTWTKRNVCVPFRDSITPRNYEQFRVFRTSRNITCNRENTNVYFSVDSLMHLLPLLHLETVGFAQLLFNDNVANLLSKIPSLKSIEVWDNYCVGCNVKDTCRISPKMLPTLCNSLPNLEYLDFHNAHLLDDESIKSFSSLTRLKYLDISNSSNISSVGLHNLLKLSSLEILKIKKIKLSTEDIELIKNIIRANKNLKEIHIPTSVLKTVNLSITELRKEFPRVLIYIDL